MNTPSSTSPARGIDQELLKKLLERSQTIALEKAGESEMAVKEVEQLQRQSAYELLVGQEKGTDGAPEMIPEDVVRQVDDGVKDSHAEMMEVIKETPDAKVLKPDGDTVGMQEDGSRQVYIRGDMLKNKREGRRVVLHEYQHTKQEEGNQIAEIPETGNATLDAQGGTLERLHFREEDSVGAEVGGKGKAGLQHHTKVYHEYVDTSDATAQFLNENGQSGDELVKKAALTVEGFNDMKQAIIAATARKNIEETLQKQGAEKLMAA